MEVRLSEGFQTGSWENRIIRYRLDRSDDCFQYYYRICEVHYVDNTPFLSTNAEPTGDDLVDLRNHWMDMLEAFGKPILDFDKDINTEEAKKTRERILGPERPEQSESISDEDAEAAVEEQFAKMGMTSDEFLAAIGLEVEDESPFDPIEYYKGLVIEAEKYERDFVQFHGKSLPDIYDLFVVERRKERETPPEN